MVLKSVKMQKFSDGIIKQESIACCLQETKYYLNQGKREKNKDQSKKLIKQKIVKLEKIFKLLFEKMNKIDKP